MFKQSTKDQIEQQLNVAKQVFIRLLDVQTQHLSANAYLLSSDFSFKRVVATQDQQTIESALENLLQRIGADTAMLVSLQQQVLANTHQPDNDTASFISNLIQQAQQHGTANAIVMLEGTPQQMVVTPIMAPDIIAWLCVSFKISNIQLQEFSQLTQADISLLLTVGNGPPTLINSSLPEKRNHALQESLSQVNWHNKKVFSLPLGTNQYLSSTLNLSKTSEFVVFALVQKSLDQELRPFYRMQWFLLVITLLSLCLAYIGSVIVARSVSRPVKALAKGVREVGKGNYDYRIHLNRSDEIGELGAAFNDMAGSQKRQVALRLAKESAESASQAKTDFLANMSHELRSPLNSILGYAQLLQQQNINSDSGTPQQHKALRTIEHSGNHLLALINEILDLSKIEAGQLQLQHADFDLDELLQQLAEMMQTRAVGKGLNLSYKIVLQGASWVKSDPQRLRQILMNLLDNAIKYTQSGEIDFKVRCEQNNSFSFSVSDTGIGIASEHLPDIFTSFHQLHQTQGYIEGTGLGLAISDRLVKLLGGELKVSSTLGQGSRFWFELNLNTARQTSQPPKNLASPISNNLGKQQKILIADGIADNRALLFDILSPLGFQLAEVSNGLECMQQAENWPADIILLNSNLAVIDGLEVCRRIRANVALQSIVIIAISANVFGNHQQCCLEAGANDFLAKPFQLETLLGLLARYTGMQGENEKIVPENAIKSTKLHYPAIDYLRRLQDFAEQGDIHRVRQLNTEISQLAPEVTLFTQQLNDLINGFKINKIRQLLNDALTETLKNHDDE